MMIELVYFLALSWHRLGQRRPGRPPPRTPQDEVLSASRQAALAAIAARRTLRSALQAPADAEAVTGADVEASTGAIEQAERELADLRTRQAAAEAEAIRLHQAEQDGHNGQENAP